VQFLTQTSEHIAYITVRTSVQSEYSQVHYVQKKTFVQNLWRFANLYIFGKRITPGVRKIMFTFAQLPLTLVAMATKLWEF